MYSFVRVPQCIHSSLLVVTNDRMRSHLFELHFYVLPFNGELSTEDFIRASENFKTSNKLSNIIEANTIYRLEV